MFPGAKISNRQVIFTQEGTETSNVIRSNIELHENLKLLQQEIHRLSWGSECLRDVQDAINKFIGQTLLYSSDETLREEFMVLQQLSMSDINI